MDSMRYDPDTNAAIPTLHIEAGPRIQVNTIGAKVSRGKLKRLIPIFEEHAVDRDLLVEGARNLRDYFQSKGYFEAQVEFKQQRVINDKANVDFLINTGKRHSLVDIEIRGNHYFTAETIRERMYLQTATFLQFPHGRYSESLLRRDRQNIENLYASNGFRDAKVTASSVDDYQGKPGHIAVILDIDEGPQYLVDKRGSERHRQPESRPHPGQAQFQPRASPSANSTWEWTAIRFWTTTSKADFPRPLSPGVPNPPPIRIAWTWRSTSPKGDSSSCARY